MLGKLFPDVYYALANDDTDDEYIVWEELVERTNAMGQAVKRTECFVLYDNGKFQSYEHPKHVLARNEDVTLSVNYSKLPPWPRCECGEVRPKDDYLCRECRDLLYS